mmetsp:Transcript_31766/g.44046  ORF Transcript_31766/g.44046 Transcript_31766/m.44046 type:complete len:272 (-) Transcript_31766:645-1460(-)
MPCSISPNSASVCLRAECLNADRSSSKEIMPVWSTSMALNCCSSCSTASSFSDTVSLAMARSAIFLILPEEAKVCNADSTAESSGVSAAVLFMARNQGCDKAPAAEGLMAASRVSMQATKFLASADTRCHCGPSKDGSSRTTFLRISRSESPSKGTPPERSRKAITPTLQRSDSGPYSYRNTSGATKYAVPAARRSALPCTKRRDNPKSIALSGPAPFTVLCFVVNKKLSGLTSQRTTPLRWQCASALSIWNTISATSDSVNRPLQLSILS